MFLIAWRNTLSMLDDYRVGEVVSISFFEWIVFHAIFKISITFICLFNFSKLYQHFLRVNMETENILIDKFLPESKKKWIIIYATWKIMLTSIISKLYEKVKLSWSKFPKGHFGPSAMTCLLKVNESVFLQFSKFSYKKIHKSVAMSRSD